MGNLTTAAVFIIIVNGLMMMSQAAMMDMNPDGTVFYHCEGSILNKVGDCSTLNEVDASAILPSTEPSISPTTGNIFTDTWTAVKGWLLGTLGLGYVLAILTAPYNWLKVLGLPAKFVYTIGSMWMLISIFVVVAWLKGTD